jgi:hypothetical protein
VAYRTRIPPRLDPVGEASSWEPPAEPPAYQTDSPGKQLLPVETTWVRHSISSVVGRLSVFTCSRVFRSPTLFSACSRLPVPGSVPSGLVQRTGCSVWFNVHSSCLGPVWIHHEALPALRPHEALHCTLRQARRRQQQIELVWIRVGQHQPRTGQ